jgi:hypothetical protein
MWHGDYYGTIFRRHLRGVLISEMNGREGPFFAVNARGLTADALDHLLFGSRGAMIRSFLLKG